uniref:Uncharacterized protein n=1 Tax=Candidatus Kentrum sp. LFY TaxID=2126342 RepID=A0A450WG05_9GAMM|nr:MAG: hypothetical protein BECKLFY1418C_GA0070996_10198 [Candidatus Kentron sp. LFY]
MLVSYYFFRAAFPHPEP